MAATGIACWIMLLLMAKLPGPKLTNGIVLGVSEATASLLSGYLLHFLKDRSCGLFFTMLCIVFNLVYRLSSVGSALALISLFISVGSLGGLMNLAFILVE